MDRNKIIEIGVLNISSGGYSAKLMKADRLVGDMAHGLPQGRAIMAIPIHCLPGAPECWVRDAGTYVVEVDAEHGLWFDWTDNDAFNTAIVPTVKGMNPITGMKTEDVTMHQYRHKCPVHDINFAHDLFCEKCGYHWPPQNYVSWPSILWLDGFRQPDGTVRQFFFTEEDKRDVASAMIGENNIIPAFGFAFYRCKNDRRPRISSKRFNKIDVNPYCWCEKCDNEIKISYDTKISEYNIHKGYETLSTSVFNSTSDTHISSINCNEILERGFKKSFYSPIYTSNNNIFSENKKFKEENKQERFTKDVSVGAGAKIMQNLEIDCTPMDEWGKNPEAVITLYFVFSEQLEAIIEKGGIKKLENQPNGYLNNVVKVG